MRSVPDWIVLAVMGYCWVVIAAHVVGEVREWVREDYPGKCRCGLKWPAHPDWPCRG